MLLLLPWIFMLIAITGVVFLWEDYRRESQRAYREQERMVIYEQLEQGYEDFKEEQRRCRKCC